MANLFFEKKWNFLLAGTAFGLVEVLSLILSGRFLGASRGYVETASTIGYILSPAYYEKQNYFYNIYEAGFSWTMAVLIGIILGSFLSSLLSGEFKIRSMAGQWRNSKGGSVTKRFFFAFIAGLVMGIATRIAGGCTLAMIAGIIQFSIHWWMFMWIMFLSGVITTFLFFREKVVY